MTDPRTVLGDRDGATYNADEDRGRLNRQARDVFLAMTDRQWHTLGGLSLRLGHPEASISARLRDLRKPRFGSHVIEREYAGNGLWRYRWLGPRDDER